MSKCCSCGIYDENCEHCEHRDAEIARLTAEVERLQAVMDAALRWYDNPEMEGARLAEAIESYRAPDGEP